MRLATLGLITALLSIGSLSAQAADKAPRARDLGVPFDGQPGPLNAITDVAGVTVGVHTIIADLDEPEAGVRGVVCAERQR